MRAALALGCCVLALVLIARGLIAWEGATEAAQNRETIVQVVSRGALLPASCELDQGDQIEAAIIAGDTVVPLLQAGLSALLFDVEGRPGAKCVIHSKGDLSELRTFVEQAEPGEFLALAHRGQLERRLAELAQELGSEAFPAGGRASWAYVCLLTDSGWRAVAETTSSTTGVMLATHLPGAALEPVARTTERLRGVGFVTLTRELPQSAGDLHFHASKEFAGGSFEAWSAPVENSSFQVLATWIGIPLGREPRLTLGLALRTGTASVRVRATISAGDVSESFPYDLSRTRPKVWIPLNVDLNRFAGQMVDVSFEAALDEADSGSPQELFFARPTLSFSGE